MQNQPDKIASLKALGFYNFFTNIIAKKTSFVAKKSLQGYTIPISPKNKPHLSKICTENKKQK